MSCVGNGECIEQTGCCKCFDECPHNECDCECSEECIRRDDVCNCCTCCDCRHMVDCTLTVDPEAHKDCNSYYCFVEVEKLNCCKLFKCPNAFCKDYSPQWVHDCHQGYCYSCNIQYGIISSTNVVDDCIVCFESKNLYTVKCNKHSFCIDCIRQLDKKNGCPLCREKIYW